MRRALLIALGVAAITTFQFEIFPGHTYLQGPTQLYVPMLERLDTPGYLSRDLVATHPSFTYTIYDEVTLFLHNTARRDIHQALIWQQILFRVVENAGVMMLLWSAGVGDWLGLTLTLLVNIGASLPGPAALLLDPEPIPAVFALGLTVMGMGFLAREKPLLAGFSAGAALVYDPTLAAPFWICVLVAFLRDQRMRRLLRPCLTILAVFALLLANLAQLQPGISESSPIFSRLPAQSAFIQQFRTPEVWVSLWPKNYLYGYLATYCICLWAVTRIWPLLNRALKWLFAALPLLGIASIPLCHLLLDHLRWAAIAQAQPLRALIFVILIAWLACSIAMITAFRRRRYREAAAWLTVCTVFVALGCLRPRANRDRQAVAELATWADTTWGSSLFLFPDAGRDLYPGRFRAKSRRGLWVDWESGAASDDSDAVARMWWDRWQQTMAAPFSPERLHAFLSLPIDYYVLKQTNRLSGVQPVFSNRRFVVYDAQDLVRAPQPFRRASTN
ncbi:MAG: hypothetical protein JO033_25675 [Acidobacteriaceae bacterium]|nr:hypothetical protein [Acidobacteriaceae bacterium]